MSRIHEALKKAQQERAGGEAPGGSQTAPDFLAAGLVQRPPAPTGGEDLPAKAPLDSVPAQGPLTYEQLLAHCPERTWLPDHRTMLFFNGRQQGVGTEEFRTLRSRLYQIGEKQPLRTLLVTSALPGEGKTFTAANLAQAIVRQHDRRALLIDGDLRRPRLHVSLGAPVSPGLSNYLLGEADEYAVLQRGPTKNLFFVPRGQEVPNPSELIANGRIKVLIDRVGPAFDWVIVDSPAAIPVSDAAVLAGFCDGLLLVVRAASTPFDVAQRVRQDFADKPVVGVVLNGADPGSAYASYYHYHYGYRPKK